MTGGSAAGLFAAGLFEEGWLAESVRATFFIPQSATRKEGLASLIGLTPDQINDRPAQRLRQEIATFDRGIVMLTEAPGRVDLIYAANLAQNISPIVQIGPLEAATTRCFHLADLLATKLGPVSRYALAPIAIRQVENEREAVELMLKYFPSLPAEPDTDFELAWSFCRKRPASTFRGRINQISKWQSMTSQIVTGPLPMSFLSPPIGGVTVFFVRVEVEINTLADDPLVSFDGEKREVYQEVYETLQTVLEGRAP